METHKQCVRDNKSLRNWASFCVLLVVFVIMYLDPFLILWRPLRPAERIITEPLPLDMAVDSIDDMYAGCPIRAASIIHLIGVHEWHFNRNFSFNWYLAGKKANQPKHKYLIKDHTIAVYLYIKVTQIRENFDEAVMVGKNQYNTDGFKFHYFYYYLTNAVRILHLSQWTHKGTMCRTAYLRTRKDFQLKSIDANMRFGSFVLATSNKTMFELNGNVSCFEIYTCFGADISYYSSSDQFGQVLIPTYEVFKVTNVLKNQSWCNVVYTLQSTKTPKSDLNCKLNQRALDLLFESDSILWDKNSLMLLPGCWIIILGTLLLFKRRQMCCAVAVMATQHLFVITVEIFKYPGNQ
ncbi:ecto-ADP-ribosyltransferase 4-like [Gouania willdenowi]|uniref:ecto-ADP-ribosyltransferase 4-like n=1 Tax=Gouania willdenowi TaxID=441366 RepID=UPI0010551821|nr:ecto-ADP-ribosyltransferase 4-like [Gouania willdenowi]